MGLPKRGWVEGGGGVWSPARLVPRTRRATINTMRRPAFTQPYPGTDNKEGWEYARSQRAKDKNGLAIYCIIWSAVGMRKFDAENF